jgi:hypothetical protein
MLLFAFIQICICLVGKEASVFHSGSERLVLLELQVFSYLFAVEIEGCLMRIFLLPLNIFKVENFF